MRVHMPVNVNVSLHAYATEKVVNTSGFAHLLDKAEITLGDTMKMCLCECLSECKCACLAD